MWSAHAGVEVPIPTPVLVPPFGVIEEKAPEEVAHLELLISPPVIVIGVEPIVVNVVQEAEPAHETVVVAALATPELDVA
jgi:hypothetical protein